MRLPLLTDRENLVVDHPVRMGFVWAALTFSLMALFELVAQPSALSAEWLGTHLAIFAVVAPAWAFSTRWVILRRRRHAG